MTMAVVLKQWRKYLMRLLPYWLLAAVMLAVLAIVAPSKVLVILYKVALTLLGLAIGMCADRMVAPYAQPSGYLDVEWIPTTGFQRDKANFEVTKGYKMIFAAVQLRRAIIIFAVLYAISSGL